LTANAKKNLNAFTIFSPQTTNYRSSYIRCFDPIKEEGFSSRKESCQVGHSYKKNVFIELHAKAASSQSKFECQYQAQKTSSRHKTKLLLLPRPIWSTNKFFFHGERKRLV
jgi:hypothetical protein